jgi:hypothetical protein
MLSFFVVMFYALLYDNNENIFLEQNKQDETTKQSEATKQNETTKQSEATKQNETTKQSEATKQNETTKQSDVPQKPSNLNWLDSHSSMFHRTLFY